MFEIWYAEKFTHATRSLENGSVKLDSVPSPVYRRGHAACGPRTVHAMDGSTVIVWYRAANPPTALAIREAEVSTRVTAMPRQLYVGRLIDILRGQNGTVYFKCRTVTRQDIAHDREPAYRTFNPSKGQLLEMTINPSAEALAGAGAMPSVVNACIQTSPAPAPVAQVALSRHDELARERSRR